MTDPKYILAVDDDPNVLKTMVCILEREGFQVTSTADWNFALQVLETSHVDLLLADLTLSRKEDFDRFCQVRTAYPDVFLVVITDDHSEEAALLGSVYQVKEYFQKPVDPSDLLDCLEKVMSLHP